MDPAQVQSAQWEHPQVEVSSVTKQQPQDFHNLVDNQHQQVASLDRKLQTPVWAKLLLAVNKYNNLQVVSSANLKEQRQFQAYNPKIRPGVHNNPKTA